MLYKIYEHMQVLTLAIHKYSEYTLFSPLLRSDDSSENSKINQSHP